jgi:hypothetical protein
MTTANMSIWSHDPMIRAEWRTTAALWFAGVALAGLSAHRLHGATAPAVSAPRDLGAEVSGPSEVSFAPAAPTSSQPAQSACSAETGAVFLPEDSIVGRR